MRSRQLYSSVTASIAGTVYFDIPDTTTIRGIIFSAGSAAVSFGDYIDAEVSLSATSQTAVSDAQGVLAPFTIQGNGAGSPTSVGVNIGTFYAPVNCQVRGGTRVYLNVTESGTATWRVRAVVWFD